MLTGNLKLQHLKCREKKKSLSIFVLFELELREKMSTIIEILHQAKSNEFFVLYMKKDVHLLQTKTFSELQYYFCFK